MGLFDGVVGALGGSAVQGLISSSSANKQMKFQERMSSTAHQREVKDLIAAGLNPILSANAGSSSPGGAMMQAPDLAGAVNSARQTSQQKQLIDAQIKATVAQAAKTAAEARSAGVTADLDVGGAKAVEKLTPAAKLLMQVGSIFSAKK